MDKKEIENKLLFAQVNALLRIAGALESIVILLDREDELTEEQKAMRREHRKRLNSE